MHFPMFVISLVLLLLLVTLTALFSFDCKQQTGHKRNQNAVFTTSLNSTLLTTTPSLVKTRLNRDISVKQTLNVGPCLSLHPFF